MVNMITEIEARRIELEYARKPMAPEPPEAVIIEKKEEVVFSLFMLPLMDASLIPKEIPKAHFTILKIRIDGEYVTEVKNSSMGFPFFAASLKDKIVAKGIKLFEESKSLGMLLPDAASTPKFTFSVKGLLNVIRGLWDYFWTRTIEVTSTATFSDFIFSKNFEIRSRIPVRKLTWSLL